MRFQRNSKAALRTVALLVLLQPVHAGLIHRYSFNDGTPKDSVGSVDGKLVGDGATISERKLILKNDPNAATDKISHLSFSSSVIPKDGNAATLVVWFTAKDVQGFARIINIGDTEGGEGRAFFYFVARTADGQSRAAISATDVAGRVPLDNEPLDDGKPHMAAIVLNGASRKMHVFIDGKEPTAAVDITDNTLDKVRPVQNFLGKSSFDIDPGLTASIDEFRVYDTALSATEIGAMNAAGPDALPAAPPTRPARGG